MPEIVTNNIGLFTRYINFSLHSTYYHSILVTLSDFSDMFVNIEYQRARQHTFNKTFGAFVS